MSLHKPDIEGCNWGIYEHYLSEADAAALAQEAEFLIGYEDTAIKRYPLEIDGAHDVTIHHVRSWSADEYPKHPATVYANPELTGSIPGLLELHERAAKDIGHRIMKHYFAINEYQVGGRIRKHRDRFDQDSLAIGLSGVGLARITDPITHETHSFELHPGMALYFINPFPQRLRPKHQVINSGDTKRLSFVQ